MNHMPDGSLSRYFGKLARVFTFRLLIQLNNLTSLFNQTDLDLIKFMDGERFQLLIGVNTNQMQIAGDRRLLSTLPPSLMPPNKPVFPINSVGGSDIQVFSKFNSLGIGQIGFKNNISQALFFPESYQLLRTDHMLSGTFEIFQVVGVINDAGVIRILVIDLDRKMVDVAGTGYTFFNTHKYLSVCC